MTAPLLDTLEHLVSPDGDCLQGSQCENCSAVRFPATDVCAVCQSRQTAKVGLPTTGTIYTYSIVHAPPPGYLGDVPYAVGIVELPNGLRVTSTLNAPNLSDLAIGAPVTFSTVELTTDHGPRTSFAYRVQETS